MTKEKTEKAKFTEGKQIPTESSDGSGFDIDSNLQLLPKFNNKDSNILFCMFEWLVDSRGLMVNVLRYYSTF